MSFFGRDWLRPRLVDSQKELIAAFAAHEFGHLVQQGMHEAQPWVSEGNAKQMSDLDIRTIEGIGVANAWAAAQAGSRACREKGRVMLGTASAATGALAVSCVAAWPDSLLVFDGSAARSIASGLFAGLRDKAVEKRPRP